MGYLWHKKTMSEMHVNELTTRNVNFKKLYNTHFTWGYINYSNVILHKRCTLCYNSYNNFSLKENLITTRVL